jgi:hypothetical protein
MSAQHPCGNQRSKLIRYRQQTKESLHPTSRGYRRGADVQLRADLMHGFEVSVGAGPHKSLGCIGGT